MKRIQREVCEHIVMKNMKKTIIAIIACLCAGILFYNGTAFAQEITTNPQRDSVTEASLEYFQIEANLFRYSNPENIKIIINGHNASPFTTLIAKKLMIPASEFLKYGKNDVELSFTEGSDGKTVLHSWSFTLKEPSPGRELTHNAPEKLEEGDVLEVTLKASPYGKAKFSINPIITDINMTETSPGVYNGKYEIRHGDNIKNGILTSDIVYPNGEAGHFVSSKKLNISAYFFKVKIISPQQDEEVDLYFDIEGRTRPNSAVYIVPQTGIGGWGNLFTSPTKSSLGSVPGAIELAADSKGYFKIHYGFPIKVPLMSMKYKFFITATDSEGNKSMTTILSVQVRKKLNKDEK